MMKHVAQGVYRNPESGVYFGKPWIDGRRTWRSRETEHLKLVKEELHRRRAGHVVGTELETFQKGKQRKTNIS